MSSSKDLADKIKLLVERGDLSLGEPAYGVALAAIDIGYERLTAAQRRLYDRVVAPLLTTMGEPAPAIAPRSDRDWRPIRQAPFHTDVEVAVEVDGEMNSTVFPCRKFGSLWINARTGRRVFVVPSHWRPWRAPD